MHGQPGRLVDGQSVFREPDDADRPPRHGRLVAVREMSYDIPLPQRRLPVPERVVDGDAPVPQSFLVVGRRVHLELRAEDLVWFSSAPAALAVHRVGVDVGLDSSSVAGEDIGWRWVLRHSYASMASWCSWCTRHAEGATRRGLRSLFPCREGAAMQLWRVPELRPLLVMPLQKTLLQAG